MVAGSGGRRIAGIKFSRLNVVITLQGISRSTIVAGEKH
jgi:hypothetical protein